MGDALLMLMRAAERLQSAGHEVVDDNIQSCRLQNWFPHLSFDTQWIFSDENGSSLKMTTPKSGSVPQGKISRQRLLSIFYPTYVPEKNAPLNTILIVFLIQKFRWWKILPSRLPL